MLDLIDKDNKSKEVLLEDSPLFKIIKRKGWNYYWRLPT